MRRTIPLGSKGRVSTALSVGQALHAGRVAPRAPSLPIGALVVGAAVLFGGTGCAKLEARQAVREGNGLYNDGRYREAIAQYDAAMEKEPDGVTVFWNRACAAESIVLKLKDPEQRVERAKFADMALRDFQTWYDRLEDKTEEDLQQIKDHRLAILDADERCDDLIQHWLSKHQANPKEESLYGVVARQYDKCGQTDKVDEWYVKRTEDFPTSVKAWHAQAIRTFEPLWPVPESGLPYNQDLSPSARLETADKVIALLGKAIELDSKFRDAYVWTAMSFTQKSLARVVVPEPEMPEEKLEALLAREDSYMAWRSQKAVCDLDGLDECVKDGDPTKACCPPSPISEEELVADREARAKLEAEIAGESTEPVKGKGKGKGKGKK